MNDYLRSGLVDCIEVNRIQMIMKASANTGIKVVWYRECTSCFEYNTMIGIT